MFAHPSAIGRSIRILSAHVRLLQMTAIGVSLQLLQACVTAFTATYLVAGHGQTLGAAGKAMAILLSASAIARVVFGWVADRTSAGLLILSLLAVAAGGATVWLVNVDPSSTWPFLTCIVLLGSSALGWNGVHMAELARLAPVDQVGEVTSAASLLGFIGTVLGPVAFALIVTVTGSFSLAFMIVASQLMIVGTMAILQLIRTGSLRDRE
jgi:nitrate/nitrite transporter NarK